MNTQDKVTPSTWRLCIKRELPDKSECTEICVVEESTADLISALATENRRLREEIAAARERLQLPLFSSNGQNEK